MSKTPTKKTKNTRADRTRKEILVAAERLFANHGFAATRLEDVAEEVELTRAALFYHFRDKQMLFDAMIENAFLNLVEKLNAILDAKEESISVRLVSAVEAWVDEMVERPTLARLLLRLVADGYNESSQNIFAQDVELPQKFFMLVQEGQKTGELKPIYADPIHTASSIIGTTVFFVSALSTLMPQGVFQPLSQEQLETHKSESVRSVQRLMGIKAN